MIADHIRAAVNKGTISEAQAADIIALAQEREGYRANLRGIDEPFELFRGFNEIMIVTGLVTLLTGYLGITGIFNWDDKPLVTIISAAGLVAVIFALSKYFTLTRRMVAPSIALSVFGGMAGVFLGLGLAFTLLENPVLIDTTKPVWRQSTTAPMTYVIASITAFSVLLVQWIWFRVPVAMALLAISVLAICFSLSALQGADLSNLDQIFLLSGEGPFSLITFVLGIIGFCVAMWFDLSDPHRVTRRAAQAFWLHVIVAPAIINTIAITLISADTGASYTILSIFLVLMAMLAIIIDRRSFLLSCFGYMIAIVAILSDGAAAIMVMSLVTGLGLIILGAFWERIRRAIMNRLPNFPGKSNLPPWGTKRTLAP